MFCYPVFMYVVGNCMYVCWGGGGGGGDAQFVWMDGRTVAA